jgi:glycosyltransferase involved in cell wall biosynthesis
LEHGKIILAGGDSLIGAFLNAFKVIRKEMKHVDYQVITTQDVLYAGLVGYIISKMYHRPLYVQMHGDHLDNPRWFQSKVGKFNRAMNVVGKFILKRADAVRVVSSRLRNQIIQNYNIKPEKIISIPIGTDISNFAGGENEKREPRIFFAQRLIHEKCPLLFCQIVKEVMDEYPHVTVGIAGEGFLQPEMEAFFTQHGLRERVTFYGKVSQSELPKLYRTSYCYIHTADWEGWGMSMIEAMAAGCPVVTTDTGCAGEAIRHNETGLVTAVNDKEALVRETKRLFADSTLWESLAKNGLEEAKEWSFDTLAKKNMEWYGNNN